MALDLQLFCSSIWQYMYFYLRLELRMENVRHNGLLNEFRLITYDKAMAFWFPCFMVLGIVR